jgi:hypothetical protein
MTAHRATVRRYAAYRWTCRTCPEQGEGFTSQGAAQAEADAHELAHNGPPVRPRVFVISSADIGRCPVRSILPDHYEDDGTCRCAEDRRITWTGAR